VADGTVKNINIKITDLGAMGSNPAMAAGWALTEVDEETDEGHRKTFTQGSYKGFEEYDKKEQTAESSCWWRIASWWRSREMRSPLRMSRRPWARSTSRSWRPSSRKGSRPPASRPRAGREAAPRMVEDLQGGTRSGMGRLLEAARTRKKRGAREQPLSRSWSRPCRPSMVNRPRLGAARAAACRPCAVDLQPRVVRFGACFGR